MEIILFARTAKAQTNTTTFKKYAAPHQKLPAQFALAQVSIIASRKFAAHPHQQIHNAKTVKERINGTSSKKHAAAAKTPFARTASAQRNGTESSKSAATEQIRAALDATKMASGTKS